MYDLLSNNFIVGRMFLEDTNYNTDSNKERVTLTKEYPNAKRNWVTILSSGTKMFFNEECLFCFFHKNLFCLRGSRGYSQIFDIV